MPDVTPHPKEAQTKPGRPRKYRRKVAGPKQWQAIFSEKQGRCRVCGAPDFAGLAQIEYHHLVPRSQGGDDVADNIVPLHSACHEKVTRRSVNQLRLLAESLTDAEYAYVISKLGEAGMERLFGVGGADRAEKVQS